MPNLKRQHLEALGSLGTADVNLFVLDHCENPFKKEKRKTCFLLTLWYN
jgi:hypothetical protein